MAMPKRTETMNTKLIFPATAVRRDSTPKPAGGRLAHWLRAQWRCLRRTGWAHEVDLHAGTCRFCRKRVNQRL